MAKKTWWKSSKGQAAIREAARSDALGAMQVGPALRNPSLGGSLGTTRAPLIMGKIVEQGPTTGFGSFRNGLGLDFQTYGRMAARKTGSMG